LSETLDEAASDPHADTSRDPDHNPGGRWFRGPPAYRARTPWRAGYALAATVAIIALGILAARYLPPYLGLDRLTAPRGPVGHPGGDQSPEITAAGLWAVATFQVVAVALTLLACIALGGRLRDALALRAAPRGWRSYAGAILAMAVLQLVLGAIQNLILQHDMLTDLRPFVGLVTGPDWALAAAVLGLGAPLSEELLFRGFLLGALARSHLGFWGAALVSTMAWTALHAGYSAVGLAEVFAIGLLLSWVLWRTGSLRVTIFCHALYNSLIVLALRLVELPA
jgi:membrane protease YdiL (CAAX protease family)